MSCHHHLRKDAPYCDSQGTNNGAKNAPTRCRLECQANLFSVRARDVAREAAVTRTSSWNAVTLRNGSASVRTRARVFRLRAPDIKPPHQCPDTVSFYARADPDITYAGSGIKGECC